MMGASVPIWVEVAIIKTLWVESYGVTSDEAVANVERDGHIPTGKTAYEYPEQEPPK